MNTITKDGITLFYRGDISLLERNIVAVVGKRDVERETLETSYNVGKLLAQNGYVVLNGLALGCDKEALEGALSVGGRTIIVLPCGIDDIYPVSCKSLAERALEEGGVIVSQYPPGTKPAKFSFIERDWTQAKIANKVISIFCDEKGGTMHTLKYAKKENKDIGCVMDCSGNRYALHKLNARNLKNETDIIMFAKEEPYTQMSLFDFQGIEAQ